ncbi:MAG: 7-cyano-7-deazaguanine synthase QueC [Dehalococcoidia bacterium]|nr:7-cyano-7-deazaguanine synthase QueC [Dehalococcoidia bacterium]MCB9486846.1 7-cyano-7-deazaguanine synthase QueC [Thermoflexaceae bacterium]
MTVMHGIVLLSGGLDSTTVAADAIRAGHDIRGLCLSYGQLHAREVDAASAVATRLRIPLEVVDAAFYGRLASFSSLVGGDPTFVPSGRSPEAIGEGVPSTYVPLRNTFFVTVAAAALESWTLDLIERQGVEPSALSPAVFVGANAIDYSGYPDCRPEFYQALEEVLRLGSKLGSFYGVRIRIEAPIIHLSKADIARHAIELGAPIDVTWSCYRGGERPCGTCDSCVLRAEGFAAAGIVDPALPAPS